MFQMTAFINLHKKVVNSISSLFKAIPWAHSASVQSGDSQSQSPADPRGNHLHYISEYSLKTKTEKSNPICVCESVQVYLKEAPWPSAQAEIRTINAYKTPRDKVQCILRMCSTIMNLLSLANEDAVPGADDFVPVLVFVLIKVS